MRVLLVSQEYPPETGWGGIGTYLGLHAPALRAAGHDVHVLSVVPGQEHADDERDGVHVHRRGLGRIRGPGRFAQQTWGRLELAWAVRRHLRSMPEVDVIESPEWMAESLMIRVRPIVVRLHSSAAQIFPHVGRTGRDAAVAIALERRGMTRADLLIGSAVQIEAIASERGLPPAVEIPYPIAKRPVRPAWTEGAPRIVFAGRFEPRKGPDLLVEALPHVVERFPEARLVLVGRDTTNAADSRSVLDSLLTRARELGVEDSIDIEESWGQEAVEAALEGAAVCAVPSRWESFGYVAAEALSGATPTIVSSWPSLAEIAGAGEAVVAAESGADWARALTAAVADPKAARAAAEESRLRLQRFASPEVVADLSAAAYERARRGPRSPRGG